MFPGGLKGNVGKESVKITLFKLFEVFKVLLKLFQSEGPT